MASALTNTKLQFVAIIFAVMLCTAWIANSPGGQAIGSQNVAFIGLALVLFVAFAFSNLFFKASSQEKKPEKDVLDEVPREADPSAVSKLIEMKYADRNSSGGPAFEEMYKIRR